jgi:PadR family transcriptional regulator
MARDTKRDLLPGTLDMLILGSITNQAMHGYGIAQHIQRLSREKLRIEEGSLYPALYRMEEQGLIESEWRVTDNNRKAKFYRLTRKGRAAADAELDSWLRLSKAVTRVLRGLEQGA